MTPIYRCYHQHGPAPWLSVSRDYHGALSRSPPGQCSISPRSAPSARAHITVITFRTKNQRPKPVIRAQLMLSPWLLLSLHWTSQTGDILYFRLNMSNLVSFTGIIDWKDKSWLVHTKHWRFWIKFYSVFDSNLLLPLFQLNFLLLLYLCTRR